VLSRFEIASMVVGEFPVRVGRRFTNEIPLNFQRCFFVKEILKIRFVDKISSARHLAPGGRGLPSVESV
jgi:hypothetical protein